jgi:hypothetical protein
LVVIEDHRKVVEVAVCLGEPGAVFITSGAEFGDVDSAVSVADFAEFSSGV